MSPMTHSQRASSGGWRQIPALPMCVYRRISSRAGATRRTWSRDPYVSRRSSVQLSATDMTTRCLELRWCRVRGRYRRPTREKWVEEQRRERKFPGDTVAGRLEDPGALNCASPEIRRFSLSRILPSHLSVLLYIFYRSLSRRARSQTSLSLHPFPSSSVLSPLSPLSPSSSFLASFVASVDPRASSPPPLRYARSLSDVSSFERRVVLYRRLSLARSFLTPSVLGPDGPTARARGCDWPAHGPQDRTRERSLLLCSGYAAEIRKRSGKEKERDEGEAGPRRRNKREESDRYDYYSRVE